VDFSPDRKAFVVIDLWDWIQKWISGEQQIDIKEPAKNSFWTEDGSALFIHSHGRIKVFTPISGAKEAGRLTTVSLRWDTASEAVTESSSSLKRENVIWVDYFAAGNALVVLTDSALELWELDAAPRLAKSMKQVISHKVTNSRGGILSPNHQLVLLMPERSGDQPAKDHPKATLWYLEFKDGKFSIDDKGEVPLSNRVPRAAFAGTAAR